MNRILKFGVPTLCGLLFAGLAWYRLVVENADFLYAIQEHSLWLPGQQFFEETCQHPLGLLAWCGRYLTQYLYYPALGASILILLWLFSYALVVLGTRMRWWLTPLALLPQLLLLWAFTAPGYYLYVFKVSDYWFTPTLLSFCFSLLIACCQFSNWKLRAGLQSFIALVGIGWGIHWAEASEVPDPLCTPFCAPVADDNFQAELRMEKAAIEGDWHGICYEMRHTKSKPTRQMFLYNVMALYHSDRLINEWTSYLPFTQLPVEIEEGRLPMVRIGGSRLHFLNGCNQFAYRWSMEDMVEYGMNIRTLRQMAECSLVGGEYDVVRKYTGILKKTLFHREEAEHLEALANHPELLNDDPKYRKIMILATTQNDMIDTDDAKCEMFLRTHYSTLVNGNSAALNELGLYYAMQTQDIQRFWNQFFAYANIHSKEDMPHICQEAAYLYGTLEPQSVDISKMPFDQEVIDTYKRFMNTVQTSGSRYPDEKALGAGMQREFGKTFFWFYYFYRNLETY